MKRFSRIGLLALIAALLVLPAVPAQPAYTATNTWQVGADMGDVFRRLSDDVWIPASNRVYVGSEGALYYEYSNGLHFVNLAITNGATINEAYLTFKAKGNFSANTVNSKISAEDVDDAVIFADNKATYDSRFANNTTAIVNWDAIGTWTDGEEYVSPDIRTVIQEIVDRPGWASGQDMVIFWEDSEDRTTPHLATVQRTAYSHNEDPTKAPKLTIIWNLTPTTGEATAVTSSSATLHGTAPTSGSPWDVRFNYGLTTGYGTDTTYEVDQANSYAFSKNIGSLDPGTVYHVRAQAKDYSETLANGADIDFLTKPGPPTEFNAQRGDTQITLTWTKGDGADKTMVRMKEDSYPTTTGDGTQVYFDTDATTTKAGLSNGITYYFSAWSEITDTPGQQYSATYVTDYATPGEAALAPPDTLAIDSVEVYTAYRADGLADQLFVISYRIIYTAGNPPEDVSDYFNIDIMDGDTLKARSKVLFWGYRPGSIYLSPASTLTWGGSYIVKIKGTETMWTTPPETSYSLSSYNWRGADLTDLDEWVLILANNIEDVEELYTWVEFAPGGGQYLSDYGGRVFRNAISGLAVRRPGLFSSSISEIGITTTKPEDLPRTYESSLADNLGAQALERFGNLGAHIGLSDMETAGAFWLVVMILVIGGVTVATGSGLIGALISLPVLFAGTYLGVVPLAIVAILGTFAGMYFLMNLWLTKA